MKKTSTKIMGVMGFVLFFLFPLQVAAEQGKPPMMGQGVTDERGAEKSLPERQRMGPWMARAEPWRRVPRSLPGKIYLWERYLVAERGSLLLTETQLDEIGSLLNAQRKYRIRKWAEQRVIEIEIEELLVKEPVDLMKVEEKVQASAAISADIAMEEIRTLQKALSVLTPEQQREAMAFMRESTFAAGNR